MASRPLDVDGARFWPLPPQSVRESRSLRRRRVGLESGVNFELPGGGGAREKSSLSGRGASRRRVRSLLKPSISTSVIASKPTSSSPASTPTSSSPGLRLACAMPSPLSGKVLSTTTSRRPLGPSWDRTRESPSCRSGKVIHIAAVGEASTCFSALRKESF